MCPPAEVPTGWIGVLRARGERGRPAVLVHADTPALRRMAAFDVVVNNADRKGGHVLAGTDGHLYGVDHGLTLHVETLAGRNSHHIAETCFKAVARVMRAAMALDPRIGDSIPSTKGTLTA